MKQIFVNEIINQNTNVTYGMAVINKTVKEDLEIMFKPEMIAKLLNLAKDHAADGGINTSTKFCQYVAMIQIKVVPSFDGMINFIDCHGSIDAALDEYLTYSKNEWPKEQRDKFIKYAQEIQNNPPTELAEMIIKDPVDDINSYST